MKRFRVAFCLVALLALGCHGWFEPTTEISPDVFTAALEGKYGSEIYTNPSVAEQDIEAFTMENIVDPRWSNGKLVWTLPSISDQVSTGVRLPPITGVPAVDLPAWIGSVVALLLGAVKIDKKRKERKTKTAAEAVPK